MDASRFRAQSACSLRTTVFVPAERCYFSVNNARRPLTTRKRCCLRWFAYSMCVVHCIGFVIFVGWGQNSICEGRGHIKVASRMVPRPRLNLVIPCAVVLHYCWRSAHHTRRHTIYTSIETYGSHNVCFPTLPQHASVTTAACFRYSWFDNK